MELEPPPADARTAYGDDENQFGELRVPPGDGPYPVAVLIHGGFWRAARDLRHMGHLAAALRDKSIATWSLEYRRVGQPGGGWPLTGQDVRHGLLHLKELAGFYRLDLSRIVVVGFSAGGQLALWLAAEQPLPIQGAVSIGGAIDLRRMAEMGLGEGAVQQYLGDDLSLCAEASPYERLPLGVETRIFHGAQDDIVPVDIARHFHQTALAKGDPSVLYEWPKAGHFEPINPARLEGKLVVQAVVELCG